MAAQTALLEAYESLWELPPGEASPPDVDELRRLRDAGMQYREPRQPRRAVPITESPIASVAIANDIDDEDDDSYAGGNGSVDFEIASRGAQ